MSLQSQAFCSLFRPIIVPNCIKRIELLRGEPGFINTRLLVKIVIISPENKIVGNLEYELPRKSAPVTEKQKPVMMQVMLQVQFAAPLEGGYWFDVSFEGQSLGGAPLTVAYRDLKEIEETEGAK